ncbi:MAG: DUF4236 domain-containing protein [Rhizobiales bacterium]|nr:DUF4236 domain-containing protein [Hyphomicrobiales bacterium]
MGFRFRRSVKIAPGIRINFNKNSTSVRIGPRGLGYTISSTGKKRAKAGATGTAQAFDQAEASARKGVPSQSPGLMQRAELVEKKKPFPLATIVFIALAASLGLSVCNERKSSQQHLVEPPSAISKDSPATSSDSREFTPAKQGAAPEPSPAPVPAAEPISEHEVDIILYTTASVRLREEPSTKAGIIKTIPAGAEVRQDRVEGKWRRVSAFNDVGWIHRDYLSEEKPELSKLADSPAAAARAAPAKRSRSGEPLRAPRVGRCDCPYDLMRNGRACGGRSAYSRPGGRSPVCYF